MKVFAHIDDTICQALAAGDARNMVADSYLIENLVVEFTKCAFVDAICIWTESKDLAEAAEKYKDRVATVVVPHRNNDLITPSPDEWDRMTAGFMMDTFGTQGDIRVYADIRHLLLSANTLEKMFDRLLEDEQANVIYPVYKVDPHLYLSRDLAEEFHPVWEYQGLDRQKYPQLYRRVHAFIHHPLRPRFKQPLKELHHVVPWYEGKAYFQGETIGFAKYLIEKNRILQNAKA